MHYLARKQQGFVNVHTWKITTKGSDTVHAWKNKEVLQAMGFLKQKEIIQYSKIIFCKCTVSGKTDQKFIQREQNS